MFVLRCLRGVLRLHSALSLQNSKAILIHPGYAVLLVLVMNASVSMELSVIKCPHVNHYTCIYWYIVNVTVDMYRKNVNMLTIKGILFKTVK
jgi:hypothetical protein